MNLNTAHKFLILIQHPVKSRFIINDPVKAAGLIGAILLDLSHEKAIEIEGGKLIPIKAHTNLSSTHQQVLNQIGDSAKKRKIKTWVSKLTSKNAVYQKDLALDLERQGIFNIENKKFLFFKYYKTTLRNSSIQNQLIKEIRTVIFSNAPISESTSILLGLIEACKLYKVIAKDKQEIKICKSKVKEIIQSDSIAQGVDTVIKEMQAAIMAAVVTSSIVITTSN